MAERGKKPRRLTKKRIEELLRSSAKGAAELDKRMKKVFRIGSTKETIRLD